MKMIRRILPLTAAVLFGFAAGWMASPSKTVKEALPAFNALETDALEAFRTEREQLRAMERAQLSDIIHDSATEAEIRGMAQRRMMEINARQEAENTLEGVISMRGGKGCVVTVGSDSVNVLVPEPALTRQESQVILELVCRETGVLGGNVKIIPINSDK